MSPTVADDTPLLLKTVAVVEVPVIPVPVNHSLEAPVAPVAPVGPFAPVAPVGPVGPTLP